MTAKQPQNRYRIAIIQEKDCLEDTYKTRTVIGLLPYERRECDRLIRFLPEEYPRPAPAGDHAMIYDSEHPNGISFPEYANAIRRAAIYELLKDLGYGCPGGEASPICEMCKAKQYCIELRREEVR